MISEEFHYRETTVTVNGKEVAAIGEIDGSFRSIQDAEPGSKEHNQHMQSGFDCMDALEITLK